MRHWVEIPTEQNHFPSTMISNAAEDETANDQTEDVENVGKFLTEFITKDFELEI